VLTKATILNAIIDKQVERNVFFATMARWSKRRGWL